MSGKSEKIENRKSIYIIRSAIHGGGSGIYVHETVTKVERNSSSVYIHRTGTRQGKPHCGRLPTDLCMSVCTYLTAFLFERGESER